MTGSSTPPSEPFDNPAYYDALIDWPKRLAREAPFFKKHFAAAGVRRVLDAACGTGRHAAMFHEWGLEVEAADLSATAVEYARHTHGQHAGLCWVQRSFTEPTGAPGTFDAVVCLGNSLALAGGAEQRARACAAMLEVLRPGGICIIQVLNLWSLPEGPTQWQKCRRVVLDGEDHILLKALHRTGSCGFVDLVDLRVEPSGGLERRIETAESCGAERVDLYGDYEGNPYLRPSSTDLIVVAYKQHAA